MDKDKIIYDIKSSNVQKLKEVSLLFSSSNFENDNHLIIKSDSLIVKEMIDTLIKHIKIDSSVLIIYSDYYRYGRKFIIKNNKVVEYYHGNYDNYEKFIEERVLI